MTAIVSTDIQFYLSAPSASAGNATAGTAGSSWGGYLSTTALSGTPLDNLFTDITGAENAASQVDYACVFIVNNTASGNSMLNTIVWLPTSSQTSGGATVTMGLDATAASAKASSSLQAVKITSNLIAPSGVSTWVSPTSSTPTSPSYTNGLQLGTLAPGYCKAIWLKRTAANTVAVNNDGTGFQVLCDSMG